MENFLTSNYSIYAAGCLGNITEGSEGWYDELYPTNKNLEKVAQKFMAEIDSA